MYGQKNALHLTDKEWNFVEEYSKSLTPAKKATVRLQEEQLTLGSFYGIWMQCKCTTGRMSTPLAQELVKAMEKREPQLMENDALLASVFLDPRYLSLLPLKYHEAAITKLEKLWQKLDELDKQSTSLQRELSPSASCQTSTSTEQLESVNSSGDDEAFIAMCNQANSTRVVKPEEEPNLRRLLEEYRLTAVLRISGNILQYWEEKKNAMPQLYRLATIVHAAPATQVSVERLFSGMHFIFSSLRANLTSAILDDIMVIRCNYHNHKRVSKIAKNTPSKRQRRCIESEITYSGSSGSSTSTEEPPCEDFYAAVVNLEHQSTLTFSRELHFDQI